jgi:TatD DNase family protein
MMDMHCHIDLYSDPDEIIRECVQNNLYILSVTTTPRAWKGTYALTKDIPRFKTALGLHPQLAHEREHELPLFDSLISETKYIGEIGLDGSREYTPYIDGQLRVFRHILDKCQKSGSKIMTIHSRGAVSLVLDELEKYPNAGIPILHWFLGTKKELNRAIDLGCMFSVGPAMSVSQKGKKIIEWIPRNKILIETDGPFAMLDKRKLRPVDSFLVLEYLSKEWCIPIEAVNNVLKNNLRKLIL